MMIQKLQHVGRETDPKNVLDPLCPQIESKWKK